MRVFSPPKRNGSDLPPNASTATCSVVRPAPTVRPRAFYGVMPAGPIHEAPIEFIHVEYCITWHRHTPMCGGLRACRGGVPRRAVSCCWRSSPGVSEVHVAVRVVKFHLRLVSIGCIFLPTSHSPCQFWHTEIYRMSRPSQFTSAVPPFVLLHRPAVCSAVVDIYLRYVLSFEFENCAGFFMFMQSNSQYFSSRLPLAFLINNL